MKSLHPVTCILSMSMSMIFLSVVLTMEVYNLSIDNWCYHLGYVYFVNNENWILVKIVVSFIQCVIHMWILECQVFCRVFFVVYSCFLYNPLFFIGNFSMWCHVEKLVISTHSRCFFAGIEKNWLFVLVCSIGFVSCYFVCNPLVHLKGKYNFSSMGKRKRSKKAPGNNAFDLEDARKVLRQLKQKEQELLKIWKSRTNCWERLNSIRNSFLLSMVLVFAGRQINWNTCWWRLLNSMIVSRTPLLTKCTGHFIQIWTFFEKCIHKSDLWCWGWAHAF